MDTTVEDSTPTEEKETADTEPDTDSQTVAVPERGLLASTVIDCFGGENEKFFTETRPSQEIWDFKNTLVDDPTDVVELGLTELALNAQETILEEDVEHAYKDIMDIHNMGREENEKIVWERWCKDPKNKEHLEHWKQWLKDPESKERMKLWNVDPSRFKDLFENPKTFDEAWNHPDPFQRKKWRMAIKKEFDKMESKKVWKKIKRSEMESGRRCVKHKWVFEIKRSGIFRARLVACGYSQLPMLDYDGSVYSPVVNDVTFRIAIIMMIVNDLDAVIFDIETAFLLGDLKELIYMDCPQGFEHEDDECLLLTKTIYGLVQSSRQYNLKFVATLKSLGFSQSVSDPCLFMRGKGDKLLIILTYVDDNLTLGKTDEIKKFLNELKNTEFTYTVEENLQDYLSCEIRKSADGKKGWIGQPHMVKKIQKTFEEDVKGLQKYNTPGTPGFKIIKPKEDESLLPPDLQSRYRTGVGMLMYLIKHSRPDIMNAVRELAKVLGKATIAAYKEMLRCIKFVIDTKSKGLKVIPETSKGKPWVLEVFSDSDWAGNPDDRKSVGCLIIFLNGVPVAWRSRAQRVVSLSSSEAEFYACAEAVREVPFIAQILLFLGIQIELPVKVWIDNVGAIFMTENKSSSSRTRHMDNRFWYVHQLQEEDGLIKVNFVRTKENVSDIGTKNVNAETYNYHEPKLIAARETIEKS